MSGFTTNAEFARVLAGHFHPDISERDIGRWRGQHPAFDHACYLTMDKANMQITGRAYAAAMDGDTAMIRFWLERRNPAFMPKSKLEHSGRVTSLQETLARRNTMTEAEAHERGLLLPGDPDDAE